MANFKEKYGPWALITGASSGIGKEFAHQIAQKGINVVLVGRRTTLLKEVENSIKGTSSVKTLSISANLSTEEDLKKVIEETRSFEIGLLINNAGFATTGEFVENSLEQELNLLHLNCRAPLVFSHHFGKQMKERGRGGIIITSSTVAFAAVSHWSNYAASKSYDLLLGEGLSIELKPYGVDVLALCPGSTVSGFQEVSGTKAAPGILKSLPVNVVQHALKKLGKKHSTVPGTFYKVMSFSTRLQPRSLSSYIFHKAIH